MGFVDRGGSRESKGNSLRRSKKNPGAAAARAAGAKQAIKPPAQPEAPPALHKATKKNPFFDCSAALLSRQFDADLDDVLDRAEQNCAGIVVWSADIDKQQQVVAMSQENNGFVYCAVGLHPDNVRGTHQREFEKWFQQVEDVSKMRGCVAILSGLNLLRETATHFSQETVLKTMMATAKKNGRPLILHCAPKHAETAERLLLLLEEFHQQGDEEGASGFPVPVIMHTFLTVTNFNSQIVKKYAKLGCYFTVSAAELHSLCGKGGDATAAAVATTKKAAADNEDGEDHAVASRTTKQSEEDLASFIDCLFNVIAPTHILLASDAPWHTPQTIDDDYVRSQKNEPSNFPNIIEALELAVATFAGKQKPDGKANNEEKTLLAKLKQIVDGAKDATVAIFKIPEKDVEVVAAPAAVENDDKKNKDKKGGKKGGKHDSDDEDEGNSSKKKGGKKGGKHDSDDEDEAHNGKKKGGKKGGKHDSDDEDEGNTSKKKGGKGGKKGGKHDSDDEDEAQNSKKKGGKKGKKGGRFAESSDEDSDNEGNANGGKKGGKSGKDSKKAAGKNTKKTNNDDDSDNDSEDSDKGPRVSASAAALIGKKAGGGSGGADTYYGCLKCRAKLFLPSDLMVPDDASLCSQGYFVKVKTASAKDEKNDDAGEEQYNEDGELIEEEEDENNKYLPATLRITPHTNGEIECRKCNAPKIGRAGFKLGVPGFGIKITPSKVEIIDTEVSFEELQRRAIAEAERFKEEAEAEENASSEDDKKPRVHKKNVKANNRSNFTHFRNKNFAPKGSKVTDEIPSQQHGDSDGSDSEAEKNEKGKRRK